MSGLAQDLRYGLRSLAKSPGFTAVTLVTLALGIGANTAIFSVVDAVLLRPLPFLAPDRLVVLRELYAQDQAGSVSGPNFLDWRARNHVFERMAASRVLTVSLAEGGEPEELRATTVSADFFRVLGVLPILGRGFLPGEDQGQGTVVVIGENLWRSRLGADSGIVGRTLTLSGRPYTVIGVAPASFTYPGRSAIWLPLGFGLGQATQRESHSFDVVARIKPGVTVEQAAQDLSAVARALAAEYPATNTGRGALTAPLTTFSVRAVRPALLLLTGAVAFVLLIACANVANLFLARASGRQREMAVRSALGAGRWRLARQVLVEAVLLAGAGGLLGLLLASWAIDLLLALQPAGIPRLREVRVDGSVLLFTLGVSLLVGLGFGAVPALTASTHDPARSFSGAGRATGSRRSRRFRSGLVVTQVSLALVLLVAAALLIVSVHRLAGVELGFRPEGAVTFDLSLAPARYPDADSQRAFVARVLDRLRAIPGVREAGAVFFLPLGSGSTSGDVSVEGEPPAAPGREHYAGYRLVAGDYLRAIGITRRGGRLLGPEDVEGAPPVALVNEALVHRFLGGRDPIGRRITFGSPDSAAEWRTIVGVVGNVRHDGLAAEPQPEIYVPQRQLKPDDWSSFVPVPLSFVVRSGLAADALAPAVKGAVREVDPQQPIAAVRDARDLVRDATARYRFNMLLLTLFGLLALTLAAVGVYAVMAYAVSQRTHELGIRMALGARTTSVQALVLGQGLRMALAGVAIGAVGALAITRLLAGLLYEVSPSDPKVVAGAGGLLAGVSLVACLLPALRATRVDPVQALRSE